MLVASAAWGTTLTLATRFQRPSTTRDDDQLQNGDQDEQVNLVEGTSGLRKEKGYALTDERHRITLYGEAKLPFRFSLAPLYTFGSGVAADTYLPGTANINGATGSRLPLLPRNALGREIKNSNQLNARINQWNALPVCPGAYPCNAGGPIANVPANINFFSPFSSLDLRLRKDIPLRDGFSLSLIGEGIQSVQRSEHPWFEQCELRWAQHLAQPAVFIYATVELLPGRHYGGRLLWVRWTACFSVCRSIGVLIGFSYERSQPAGD